MRMDAHMQTKTSKTSRLSTRLTTEQKKLFERAAAIRGMTLSDFVLFSLQEAAEQAVDHQERMELSPLDQKRFVETLLDPPEPNSELRKAKKAHTRYIGK